MQRGRSKLRRWGAVKVAVCVARPLLNSPLPQLSKVGGQLPPLPPLLLPLCNVFTALALTYVVTECGFQIGNARTSCLHF